MRRHISLLFLPFFACCLVHALPDYDQGILDVAKVMQSAAAVTATKFPNADDVLVDDAIISEYAADGTAVTYDETFFKVLTEKGRRGAQSMSRHFTLPYSQASYTLVEVIRADGTRIPVDLQKQSRVMVDRSQMSANIYNPNSKILQVSIPEVAIGDTVHYIAKRVLVKPRVPNTWSDFEVLEYTSPIVHFVREVRAPKELPLSNIALKSEVPGTVDYQKTEEGGFTVHRWEVANVPRMYSEPNMPKLYTVVQRLLVSTIPDWPTISRWYWELSKPHLVSSPEMKAKVAELLQGKTNRQEQIRSVFRFVSQEIRYMGITTEKEAPGYEPHDAVDTFNQRHGVCRDKAALLVAMLREAKFDAFPVLINNGPKKDEEVPQPYFNHAIVAVREADGSYQLMDPTDENTKQLFPAYLCNQSYLVATPEGEKLLTSPIVPATDNLMNVKTTAKVDAKGFMTGRVSLDFSGINDNAYRGYFTRIKPEQRRRFFAGVVKNVVAGAELTACTILPENLMDTETPFSVELGFQAKSTLVTNKRTSMLVIPQFGTSVGMVNFILRNAGLEKRKFPFVNDYACGVRETLSLDVAPELGGIASLPSFPAIDGKTLSWKRELAPSAGGFTGTSEFLIKVVEFSPEEYLALRETLKTLEINARKMPILSTEISDKQKETEAKPDVVLEKSEIDIYVENQHNWTTTYTTRKQILTYKGKKDNSELKLNYNPAWETLKLIKATVRTGDKVQTISDKEINEMDQGWVGSAPRYPAGKTLVASLPGVEIGSVIEYQWSLQSRNKPFFAAQTAFQSFDPMLDRSVRLSVPAGMTVAASMYNAGRNLVNTAKLERGREIRTWTVKNQPAIKRERHLPPLWNFAPYLFLSAGDWRTYSQAVRTRLVRATYDSKKAIEKAFELIQYKPTDAEKVVAIRDFVSRNIRGAGPGFNSLPFEAVTPADKTLKDGYGNSADRAILLFAMLRAVNFRPQFVLASWSDRAPQLRQVLAGNPDSDLLPDVLVQVKVAGKQVLLNDTSQYAELGMTGHDQRLGLYLKRGRLDLIAARPGLRDRQEVNYTIDLDSEGNAKISKRVEYFGPSNTSKRKFFAELPPEERRRHYQETLARLSQSARAESDLKTDFRAYPGIQEFTASVGNYAIVDGDFFYFKLPFSYRNLFGLRADSRENPFSQEAVTDQRIVQTILLPKREGRQPDFELVPERIAWQGPNGTGMVKVSCESLKIDNRLALRVVHDVQLNPAVVPAEEYQKLLALNSRLAASDGRTILLKFGK